MTESFLGQIDSWVEEEVLAGACSFAALLLALPSVDPSVVLNSLTRLATAQSLSSYAVTQLLSTVQPPTTHQPYQDDLLPVPHPLDYEWRFAPAAIQTLLQQSLFYSCQGDLIALLGSPSVAKAVIEQSHQRSWVLLDANPGCAAALANRVSALAVNLFDVTATLPPRLDASVVIADPPWYPEHFRLFLWAASHLLRRGGYVLLSVPPLGTRPGMEQERIALELWASTAGFQIIEYHLKVLPYITPPFEQNTFRTLGLPAVPSPWRYGDLAVFRFQGGGNLNRPPVPDGNDEWREHTWMGVRIKLRHNTQTSFCNPVLQSVVSGDILPSVSRRDERRQQAEVWTSGNRVFACQGTLLLGEIIQAMREDQSPLCRVRNVLGRPLHAAEKQLVQKAGRQVRDLVALERQEYLPLRRREC